jgi:hypothetical protein
VGAISPAIVITASHPSQTITLGRKASLDHESNERIAKNSHMSNSNARAAALHPRMWPRTWIPSAAE